MKVDFPVNTIIYHAPCSDGFCSAWAAWKHFPQAEFHEGIYENNRDDLDYWLEKVKGKNVLVADFSFKREILEQLHEAAAELQLIDHHKTAMGKLGDLPYCYFDMSKSGAWLTWEALTDEEVPRLVRYTSDHDLWEHKLPHSYEIATALCHKKKDFNLWSSIAYDMEYIGDEHLITEGKSILQYLQDTSDDIRPKALIWELAGREVLAVNGIGPMVNEICDNLRNHHDGPVACYEVLDGKVKFSLRSLNEVDVGEIAEHYPGGGGHLNSAAFTIPIEKVDWLKRKVNV